MSQKKSKEGCFTHGIRQCSLTSIRSNKISDDLIVCGGFSAFFALIHLLMHHV